MQDRVPTYPGRVTLTPVPGQANTYDLVRADDPTQEGTPLNKATLLKDATALLFGLTTEAVPDDVFALLERFNNGLGNEYIWKKYLQTSGYVLVYGAVINQNFNDTSKMYASSSVTVDAETGEITFVDPQKVPSDMASAASFVRGKYIYFLNGSTKSSMRYIKSATYSDSLGGSVDYTYQDISSAYKTNISEESYVNSPDPEAYPPKVPDGYQYSGPVQLGTFAEIETGSYTGTGTYGENNPNRLTFKGKPIVVFIVDHNYPSYNELMRVWMFPCFAYNRNNNEYDDPGYFNIAENSGNGYGQPEYIFAKVSGTTLMWYGEDGVGDQINQSTYRYYYFALTSLGGAST